MRPNRGFRDRLFGSGLVVALTLVLGVAAMLAAFGLFLEIADSRTVVVTQRPTMLVASQFVAEASDQAVADDDAASDHDPSADPGGVHTDAVDVHEMDDTLALAPADQHSAEGGITAAADPESGTAAGPEPEPADVPPAEGVAEEPPKPAAPVVRVRPTPGPHGAPRQSADLPIVMYHHVGPLPPNPDIYRRDLTVAPDLFDRTLAQLAEQGVETVTMADLFEHFAGGTALPKLAVVLTFDDGYDDNFDHAFRLLREHGMVGTFFISTDFVGRPGYVTWDQVVEMSDAGMEIAAHSTNHADFTRITPAELKRQLVEPKAILEEHIGQPVRFMAYPSGKYNPAVMAATKAAGYEAAVTVLHGTRHLPGGAFELRRVRARGADTLPEIMTRMAPPTWRQ